jgi:hypothetical protein
MSWMASYTKPITSSGYNGLGLSPGRLAGHSNTSFQRRKKKTETVAVRGDPRANADSAEWLGAPIYNQPDLLEIFKHAA